jgi:hypothetical protein
MKSSPAFPIECFVNISNSLNRNLWFGAFGALFALFAGFFDADSLALLATDFISKLEYNRGLM